jgi:tetratricopeptide (TPR) repeat protein
LGWVLFKLNQPSEALPFMLQAIENSEEPDATLLDHLGDIYASLKKFDQAREAWQKSLGVEPNDKIKQKLDAAATRGTAEP